MTGILLPHATADREKPARPFVLASLARAAATLAGEVSAGLQGVNGLLPGLVVVPAPNAASRAARNAELEARNQELERMRSALEDRMHEGEKELALRAEELERNQELLLRTEKMAAIGRLTAGFAHELATPLATMLATLSDLRDLTDEYGRSIGDPEVSLEDHRAIQREMVEAMDALDAAADRAASFVRGIRAHTRDPGRSAIESFDAGAVVSQATELLGYLARSARVRLEVKRPLEAIPVRGVPSRLNQAVTNLVQNAIDAAGERGAGGRVTVELASAGSEVVIRVSDDGPGIPADVLPRIFEPLFTTKPYGKGTGLGLPIVREVVQGEFQGTIEVESSDGGATFVVRIPLDGTKEA